MDKILVTLAVTIEAVSKEEAVSEARRMLRKGLFEEFRFQTYKRPDPIAIRKAQAANPGSA